MIERKTEFIRRDQIMIFTFHNILSVLIIFSIRNVTEWNISSGYTSN